MKDLELQYKLRIMVKGEKIFGEGPLKLLEKVEELGSLSRASQDLNMSYSKAWTIINKAENYLSYNLLESEIGGKSGGGSYLTEEAHILIRAYKSFKKEADILLLDLFKNHFSDINK